MNEHKICIDCKSSNSLVQNYLSILENSYVISKVTPFCGNKSALKLHQDLNIILLIMGLEIR